MDSNITLLGMCDYVFYIFIHNVLVFIHSLQNSFALEAFFFPSANVFKFQFRSELISKHISTQNKYTEMEAQIPVGNMTRVIYKFQRIL